MGFLVTIAAPAFKEEVAVLYEPYENNLVLRLLGGAILFIALLVLLEISVLKSPFASQRELISPQVPLSAKSLVQSSLLPVPRQGRSEEVYKLTQQGLVAKEELARQVKSPVSEGSVSSFIFS